MCWDWCVHRAAIETWQGEINYPHYPLSPGGWSTWKWKIHPSPCALFPCGQLCGCYVLNEIYKSGFYSKSAEGGVSVCPLLAWIIYKNSRGSFGRIIYVSHAPELIRRFLAAGDTLFVNTHIILIKGVNARRSRTRDAILMQHEPQLCRARFSAFSHPLSAAAAAHVMHTRVGLNLQNSSFWSRN